MAMQAIRKLQLSLLGFAVVADRQWIGEEAFDFVYEGDKVHITQVSNGITKTGDCKKLLEARLKDADVNKLEK